MAKYVLTLLHLMLIHLTHVTSFSISDLQFVQNVQNTQICEYNATQRISYRIPGDKHKKEIQFLPNVEDHSKSKCCSSRHCSFGHRCCPDDAVILPEAKDARLMAELKGECISPQLKPQSVLFFTNPTMLIRTKCLESFKTSSNTNKDLVDKCENDDKFTDLDTKIPVSDIKTGRAYKNKYCAQCNNVHEHSLLYWDVRVDCDDDATFTPSSLETVVPDIYNTDLCNLVYIFPKDNSVNISKPECILTVNRCNVTGLWAEYNTVIETACLAYTCIFRTRHGLYNNIFCALCNRADYTVQMLYDCTPRNDIFLPKFSALLDFNPSTLSNVPVNRKVYSTSCSEKQWYDHYKEKCRDVTCHKLKTFSNESCVNLVKTIEWIGFDIFIKLTPQTITPAANVNVLAPIIGNFYMDKFLELNIKRNILSMKIYYKETVCTGSVSFFNQTTPCVGYIVVHVLLHAGHKNPISMASMDAILKMSVQQESVRNGTENAGEFIVDLGYFYDFNDDNLKDPVSFEKLYVMKEIRNMQNKINKIYNNMNIDRSVLTQTFGCSRVRLEHSDYNMTLLTWGVTIEELNVTLPMNQYIPKMKVNGNTYIIEYIDICIDVYITLTKTTEKTNAVSDRVISPAEYLSLVCTILSIVCSILTIVVYSVFKTLRTQPGINNMALVISLIYAQALFQFGVGQHNNVSEWGCIMLGILVHFSWMNVIMWMNICSFHMLKVFYGLGRSFLGGSTLKTTFRYALYCAFMSSLPVIINMAVVGTETDGATIGYGERVCYISRFEMIGYLFALPVGIVIIANLGMFIAVIVQVRRSAGVENKKRNAKNRNFAEIYAKLSSLTGFAWIFGFLFVFTDIEPLEYVFIILNAGQGVFVFVAFVCNKRIVKLIAALTTKPVRKPTGISVTSSTNTKVTGLAYSMSGKENSSAG